MAHPIYGIHQSDIIISAAIQKGLEDLREHPWLLDFAFAGLKYDPLTKEKYGEKEIQQAKKWFLNTNVEVQMTDTPENPKFPLINIQLSSSVQDKETLADVHYDTHGDMEAHVVGRNRQVLLDAFTPDEYDKHTGTITLPKKFSTAGLRPGHVLLDPKRNLGYPIVEVIDERRFRITPTQSADLRNVFVVPENDSYLVELESKVFAETYTIGVHAVSQPKFAVYLHTILVFILLRYNEELLEGRGFERTTIQSGPLEPNNYFHDSPERVFSRTLQISGYVRHYWPKFVHGRIEEVGVALLGSANEDADPIRILGIDEDIQPF